MKLTLGNTDIEQSARLESTVRSIGLACLLPGRDSPCVPCVRPLAKFRLQVTQFERLRGWLLAAAPISAMLCVLGRRPRLKLFTCLGGSHCPCYGISPKRALSEKSHNMGND